ncbi:MAG: hypothetical protein EBZ48_13195 [Proteobacteria bacterium]|jgi:hypothetical protein|nr:hypothetical protein [Pseudomonadota bacterium]
MPSNQGAAARHLLELQTIATTVITDLIREAVALREQAVQAKTEKERDNLRYAAEGYYLEAREIIDRDYGLDSEYGTRLDDTAYEALSAIRMPR